MGECNVKLRKFIFVASLNFALVYGKILSCGRDYREEINFWMVYLNKHIDAY